MLHEGITLVKVNRSPLFLSLRLDPHLMAEHNPRIAKDVPDVQGIRTLGFPRLPITWPDGLQADIGQVPIGLSGQIELHHHLGARDRFALGGEAGARLAESLGMPTGPDFTSACPECARGVTPDAARTRPRSLGVKKKGHTYGTLLVDLETRQPIELLADQTIETVVERLRRHPGIEVIARDRADTYADAATQGAPQAIQVADRFHLLLNCPVAL